MVAYIVPGLSLTPIYSVSALSREKIFGFFWIFFAKGVDKLWEIGYSISMIKKSNKEAEMKVNYNLCTYHDGYGGEYEAIQLPWDVVEEVLGHEHEGTPEDDQKLVAILMEAGAPEWVKEAPGWIDEYGWGIIGPQIA